MTAFRHGQRGASLPETAIVVGVLLALLLGIVEFGRVMYSYAFVETARQAARWAIVRGSQCTLLDHCNATSDQVNAYAQSLGEGLTPGLTATATWVNCPPGSSGHAPGCAVSVTASYTYILTLIPFLANVHLPLSSTSQMVISQ